MTLERFEALFVGDDERIDLARACLMIAEDAYPELDIERYMGELERLGERLKERLPARAGVEERIVGLNYLLYEELGYRGNTEAYYDPRNSYLNEVMERRTGIPITLAILYMEVGRRIELPLEGVSFPGHFLVRMRLGSGVLVLDPFAGGLPQGLGELRERLHRVIPPSVSDAAVEHFLEAASKRQILTRVLRNLKAIYREANNAERMLQVINRMLIVAPDAHAELRDRAYVYERLECWRLALKDLREYLERDPDAPDIDEVRLRLMELSARCARLN